MRREKPPRRERLYESRGLLHRPRHRLCLRFDSEKKRVCRLTPSWRTISEEGETR